MFMASALLRKIKGTLKQHVLCDYKGNIITDGTSYELITSCVKMQSYLC